MGVLYIVGGEGKRYGSEIIAIDLISAGKKNNINYTVITANKGAVSEACEQLGIKYYVIPFMFFVYKALNNGFLDFIKKIIWKARAEFLTRRAVSIIEKSVNMKSIDVIHTNLSRDLLGGILSEKHNIPHVWHIHELYKTHYQLSFLRGKQLEWMSKHADRFIAISKTVANEWSEHGLPESKVCIVYNGIDLTKILPKDCFDGGKYLKLVMVGHIVPAKGQALVIEWLSKLPKDIRQFITFDCIGEGTKKYKALLQHMAKECDVTVALRGYCSNVGNILKNYDIGVNCSRGEGFGLSTIEYMAAGLCPVVANTGANIEIVDNRKNGFVFDYTDENSFVNIIKYLYINKNEMRTVAKTAIKDAHSKFTLEKMQQNIFALYKELYVNEG